MHGLPDFIVCPGEKESLQALRLADFGPGRHTDPEIVVDTQSKRLVVSWFDESSKRDVLIFSTDGGKTWF